MIIRNISAFLREFILIILLMTPVLKLLGMGSGFWDIYEGKAYEEQRREMEEAAELWNNLEISEYVADPEKSTEEDDIQIEVGEISIGH